jgi:lipopolysaccharide/colanic/teichoic acid biosynthesis glycosyltransferase
LELQVGFGDELAISSRGPSRVRDRQQWLDIAILLLAMPLILSLAAAIALAIYLDSPGTVLFRSIRVGRDGRPFEMFKFRKMRLDSEGHPLTLADDERFTPIGRFLSATHLDELPNVLNVLRGEMRLVGPRPELACFVAEFPEPYEEIVTVVPGITGLAQLRFLDERHMLHRHDPVGSYQEHILPAKIEIDLAYARSHSLGGDLVILARTMALPLVLAARRTRWATVRTWLPTAACALLLTLAFVLVVNRLQ